ncbi:PQQ-dependent sugar dehydrogenase [Luteolibacter sp. GHJ8]|uniref:PQQ-dependent sugar dehydrogenase n=1 Tax=Luteolibacter rhizosphaerae TaxID=2989719 RepID=A0ABT3G0K5_9BACT|nr:PQQ-dependent sugar dehydrogenase [Luteolibacter rhizosphaerae]MCW1913371.1 PQQ-dependent sugar dehydrogenase [Luteolibacter rhizosphaerae]
MKPFAFLLLPAIAAAAPLSISAPPDAALVTPHRVETIATDLVVPWELRFLPDGRQIFTERVGRVRIIEKGKLLDEPALVLPAAQDNKMGLLGLALAPDFARTGLLFLAWDKALGNNRFELRMERYRLEGNKLVEPRTIVEGIAANRNHTGCRLEFGPDGKLYMSTGDADRQDDAQKLDHLHGKILRFNADGSVPQDNPFVGREAARPEIWSYGHRNPQGLAFQPGTGRLYESEHGPLHGDEVNLITKGANYGWPLISHRREAEGMLTPLIEITPAAGPGRLLFYQGTAFPELRGCLLMACLRGEGVFRISLGGDGLPTHVERLWHRKWGRIRFITEAPDGSLWMGTSMQDPAEGKPREGDDRIIRLVPDPAGTVETVAGQEAAPVVLTPETTDAETIIAAACSACHGAGLAGGEKRGLLSGEFKHLKDLAELERIIRDGVPAAGMPPAGGLLTESQISKVADYIRAKRR